jgi:hypothetical protein
MELLWDCRECEKIVNDGWLSLPSVEFHKALDAVSAYEKFGTKNGGSYTVAELMKLPDGGSWSVICRECYTEDMEGIADYDIALDRIGSYKDALDWTFHLMEKNWFPYTNWEETLRAAIAEDLDA